jgi:GNAT superfamily N-acetyltransferase
VDRAAQAVDDPQGPPWSPAVFRKRLTLGPPYDDPVETWLIRAGAGASQASAGRNSAGRNSASQDSASQDKVIAWYVLSLPATENLHRAELDVKVHPAWRRRGIGTALLRHAAGRAAAAGRAVMDRYVPQGSAGDAFARQAGARYGMQDIRRRIDLTAVPAATFTRLRDDAAKSAGGYRLVTWDGPTPAEHLKGVAAMFTAMNDAPRDAGQDPQTWDEQRIRDQLEGRLTRIGSQRYMVTATCEATGEMVALSELRIDPGMPDWGFQGNTVVARAHRGHRLGLLVKAAMLEWVAAAEPGLRQVVTWNAAVNKHMIAINEELGFEICGPPINEVELRVADWA